MAEHNQNGKKREKKKNQKNENITKSNTHKQTKKIIEQDEEERRKKKDRHRRVITEKRCTIQMTQAPKVRDENGRSKSKGGKREREIERGEKLTSNSYSAAAPMFICRFSRWVKFRTISRCGRELARREENKRKGKKRLDNTHSLLLPLVYLEDDVHTPLFPCVDRDRGR